MGAKSSFEVQIKQIKAKSYVLNRLNLDKLERIKFALKNLNLNVILKRKKAKVKSLKFTGKKPSYSVNLTQLYGR